MVTPTSGAMTDCPVCGGPLIEMGQLGRLSWFRCRHCGAESSAEHLPDDTPACLWCSAPVDESDTYCDRVCALAAEQEWY